MQRRSGSSAAATGLGILAIAFWSTVVAVSRSVTEQLGPLTAASCIYLFAGTLGCAGAIVFGRGLGCVRRLPRRYLAGCGTLFVLYGVCLYLALGWAASRQQVVEIGIINYLWPGLTLVLAIPILGKKARLLLVPAFALVLGGVAIAVLQGSSLAWEKLSGNLRQNAWPYLLALVGAFAWALYSNLSRRWAGGEKGSAVPLFLLATGLVLAALRLGRNEESQWTWGVALKVAYLGVFPTLLSYSFWDVAMRRGRIVLVASLSYLCPLLSTFITSLYLGVGVTPALWLAAAMVVAGAILCSRSIVDPAEAERRLT